MRSTVPFGSQSRDFKADCYLLNRHLLLAYDASIHVYSTSTSLLIRKLTVTKSEFIVGFVLSSTDVNLLYVATNSGSIHKYDWHKGKHLGRWDISSQIFNLAGSDSAPTPAERDIIYTVDKKGQWMITAHRLSGKTDASKTELRTLLKSSEPVTALKVLAGGKIIVASSGPRLIIGSSDLTGPASLNDLSYVWREILCPEWITSLDARIPSDTSQALGSGATGANPSKSREATVDIVVGDLKGSIFVYEDVLGKLIRKERRGKSVTGQDLTPQRLHWHRNGVATTKWSLDGVYRALAEWVAANMYRQLRDIWRSRNGSNPMATRDWTKTTITASFGCCRSRCGLAFWLVLCYSTRRQLRYGSLHCRASTDY